MGNSSNLKITGLTVQRGDRSVLDNFNVSLDPGEIHLITGPSGSGKTSLALALTGLIPQQFSGTVSGDIQISNLSPATHSVEAITRKLGCMLSDSWNRFFQITVAEELAFGPYNLGNSHAQVSEIVSQVSQAFDLDGLLNRRIDTLSGGQLQRVALAAVFAMAPDFIILDEPSSCLDRAALDLLHAHLKHLRRSGQCGMILLEHRLTDFLDITDLVTVLHQGRTVFQDTTSKFSENALELSRSIGIRHPGFREPASWEAITQPVEPGTIEPVLELQDVCAGFDRTYLKNISLTLYPGVTALVGPNGCGKSTLAHVIAGFLKPKSGIITWPGNPVSPSLPDGRHVGLLVQDASSMLFCESVSAEIQEGPENYNRACSDSSIEQWLSKTGLTEHAHQHPLHLSTGQIIRTAAAATMILNPTILILDEPARGQDWAHLEAILQQTTPDITSVNQACIIITHDYKLIHRFAQYLLVMDQGQVSSYGSLKKVQHGSH